VADVTRRGLSNLTVGNHCSSVKRRVDASALRKRVQVCTGPMSNSDILWAAYYALKAASYALKAAIIVFL
jgi:hypothetical protein